MIGTGGGEKGPSQFSVSGDIFDLFDDIDESADDRRDSPVAQNPAETETETERETRSDRGERHAEEKSFREGK